MKVVDEHLSLTQNGLMAVRGNVYPQDRRFCLIGMGAGIFGR
jgi:hypothetical protein